MAKIILVEQIQEKIYLIRGQKVMLASDLAKLYMVETFNLNKAVKRNIDRFPEDFMFQLTREEADSLKFQIGMSNQSGRGGRRYLPYVFTEQGVAMLSSVLSSKRAIQVNIAIIRAFVKLREILSTHKKLAHKLQELEKKIENQGEKIYTIFEAINSLMAPPGKKKRKIGFKREDS